MHQNLAGSERGLRSSNSPRGSRHRETAAAPSGDIFGVRAFLYCHGSPATVAVIGIFLLCVFKQHERAKLHDAVDQSETFANQSQTPAHSPMNAR
jgi:hypothetical protein